VVSKVSTTTFPGFDPQPNAPDFTMRYFVTIAGREIEVDLTGAHPVVDGTLVEAQLAHLPGADTRHPLHWTGARATLI
jgi:hypothetical protein